MMYLDAPSCNRSVIVSCVQLRSYLHERREPPETPDAVNVGRCKRAGPFPCLFFVFREVCTDIGTQTLDQQDGEFKESGGCVKNKEATSPRIQVKDERVGASGYSEGQDMNWIEKEHWCAAGTPILGVGVNEDRAGDVAQHKCRVDGKLINQS